MAQADQDVANANGQTVRTDINGNLDALFTNNSGNSAPSVTSECMWFADKQNDQLKIRGKDTDTDFYVVGTLSQTNLGLAPQASPTFTGNVTIPAGTESSLPIRFTGDTDTGFYKNAANDFSIVTGGTRRAHFDANGLTIRDRKALRLRDTSNSNFVAIQAPSNTTADITLTLPNSDGNANDVLQSDGSGNLSFTALPAAVPTGSVHMMASENVPAGYLECNGASYSRTTYAALFAEIGTAYGAVDVNHFNVPDLRGEFVRGLDRGRGVDANRQLGDIQSSQNAQHNHIATATSSISPSSHNHVYPGDDQLGGQANNQGGWTNRSTGTFPYDARSSTSGGGIIYRTSDASLSVSTSVSVANDGSTDGSRPRNVAMMYVIKT